MSLLIKTINLKKIIKIYGFQVHVIARVIWVLGSLVNRKLEEYIEEVPLSYSKNQNLIINNFVKLADTAMHLEWVII
mgnify:CR=1 FL=1|jgi:hypothetical protein